MSSSPTTVLSIKNLAQTPVTDLQPTEKSKWFAITNSRVNTFSLTKIDLLQSSIDSLSDDEIKNNHTIPHQLKLVEECTSLTITLKEWSTLVDYAGKKRLVEILNLSYARLIKISIIFLRVAGSSDASGSLAKASSDFKNYEIYYPQFVTTAKFMATLLDPFQDNALNEQQVILKKNLDRLETSYSPQILKAKLSPLQIPLASSSSSSLLGYFTEKLFGTPPEEKKTLAQLNKATEDLDEEFEKIESSPEFTHPENPENISQSDIDSVKNLCPKKTSEIVPKKKEAMPTLSTQTSTNDLPKPQASISESTTAPSAPLENRSSAQETSQTPGTVMAPAAKTKSKRKR